MEVYAPPFLSIIAVVSVNVNMVKKANNTLVLLGK